jgi:hypothetical protein
MKKFIIALILLAACIFFVHQIGWKSAEVWADPHNKDWTYTYTTTAEAIPIYTEIIDDMTIGSGSTLTTTKKLICPDHVDSAIPHSEAPTFSGTGIDPCYQEFAPDGTVTWHNCPSLDILYVDNWDSNQNIRLFRIEQTLKRQQDEIEKLQKRIDELERPFKITPNEYIIENNYVPFGSRFNK